MISVLPDESCHLHSQIRAFKTCFAYWQGTTHLNLNSGFFYLQANERTISLMKRIAARLAKEKAWDQVWRIDHARSVTPRRHARNLEALSLHVRLISESVNS